MTRFRNKVFYAILFLFILASCKNREADIIIILSDLHYDSTDVRGTVIDSVLVRINQMSHEEAGGKINSVAVLGDITQDGSEMQWGKYVKAFGLNGESDLKYPVYELPGNHDGNIDGAVRTGIRERNNERRNILDVSDNGLHYSWEAGDYHLVALGIYPGLEWDPDCEWCHYFRESFRDPEMSLQFLEKDLRHNLDNKNQPVVLMFHYGWDDFSLLWWTEEEQERFYSVIRDYNIAGIFHGHDHAVEHYTWKGIDVWSAGSPQSGDKTGEFLVVNLGQDSLAVKVADINDIKSLRE